MENIDIIIIARNGADFTLNCIDSIYQYHKDAKITLVDNCSTDDTISLVQRKFPKVNIIANPENYGYAKAVNIGFENTAGSLVVVANNDIVFHENTLQPLINEMVADNRIGIIGPQQIDGDGNPGLSYGDLPGYISGIKNAYFLDVFLKKYQTSEKLSLSLKRVGYVDGGFMLIRRDSYNDVNGFDEEYFFYSEEADFCYKLKKTGWKVILNTKARVTHYRGGVSEGKGFSSKNIRMLVSSKALFCKKHLSRWEGLFS